MADTWRPPELTEAHSVDGRLSEMEADLAQQLADVQAQRAKQRETIEAHERELAEAAAYAAKTGLPLDTAAKELAARRRKAEIEGGKVDVTRMSPAEYESYKRAQGYRF